MEADAIRKVILEQYVQGGCKGDAKAVASAFSENAQIFGVLADRYIRMTAADYAAAFAEGPSLEQCGSAYRGEVQDITFLSDRAATALLREYDFNGRDFLTAFQLLRTESGTWKIVSKLFTAL